MMIDHSVRNGPAPSSAAASSIPCGIDVKKPRISQTLKGALNVTFMMIRLHRLSISPIRPNSW